MQENITYEKMITKFNLYETINSEEPQIGDYVLMKVPTQGIHPDFIKKSYIGQIIDIKIKTFPSPYYVVVFEKSKKVLLFKHSFYYWSPNRKDLELIINAEKYNL